MIYLTVFAAAFALALSIYYADQPILEFHGFRQTQTAITSYWIMRDGWQLAYQTPVAGYPWSIPFEFPIYQSIVALIAHLGNFPLDPVGRFVSLAFLLACALPAHGITRRLELSPEIPWVFSVMLWSSPMYLFWGRTFLIETTATFFTFAAIPHAIDLFEENPRWRSALLFMSWMSLGMLQKITTALPVMIVMSALLVVMHLRTFGFCLPARQKTIQVLAAFAVPVLIAGLWAYYADVVKSQNILGIEMTSKMLTSWNFGTLQQHLDMKVFKTIVWDRVFVRNLAGPLGIFILGVSLFFGERRIKIFLLASLTLFLVPIEIFINLHLMHDYYQISSTLFLLGGLSIAIVDLKQKIKPKIPIVWIVTLILMVFNLCIYKQSYWVLIYNLQNLSNKSANQVLLVSDVLRKYTPQNSSIVVFGMDWSSEISYYAERKSFTVPDWKDRPDWPGKSDWHRKYNEIWRNPMPYLGGTELGAIVFCTDQDSQFGINVSTKEVLKNQYVMLQPSLFKVANCYIWLPNVDKILLPGSNQIIRPVNSIEE